MSTKRGRPVIKKDRIKIGLSLEGESNNVLNKLVLLTGKTKSRIVEEAIDMFYKNENEKNNDNNNISSDNAMDNIRAYLQANKRT
ncbi:MAG: hypothetical protein MJK08_09600 [Campylobacterales bacterium]|nr:hypothetical protein [Campylobacterales bacterium]NQY52261.1 hypothetical protein [Campylobacteraceae bacterium]